MSRDPLQELAAAIDHTLLKPEATRSDILRLCQQAREYGFAAVCVNPTWVEEAVHHLQGSPVVVATVIGFPLGATTTAVKVFEAREALRAGARELDMVMALGLLKGGEDQKVQADVAAVVEVAKEHGASVKVILETGLLSEEEKTRAAQLAVAAGASFLKTSTGFLGSGATVEDVALLRRIAPASVGVKASGGIRTFAQARAMLAAGANRLGTSSGVAIIEEARGWYARS
ncbi:MAG: deoxyribose-phosphate aldolase [Acidobacteriota bacterium]